MNPQLLPVKARGDVPAWQQTVVAFLAEKERRSGSQRTVESYARMLWPLLSRFASPELVGPAHALAWAHGVGASGREPPSTTVGARIACLSSYFRFLIRITARSRRISLALRPRATDWTVFGRSSTSQGVDRRDAHPGHRRRTTRSRPAAGVRPHRTPTPRSSDSRRETSRSRARPRTTRTAAKAASGVDGSCHVRPTRRCVAPRGGKPSRLRTSATASIEPSASSRHTRRTIAASSGSMTSCRGRMD